jgi:hypothetical protein
MDTPITISDTPARQSKDLTIGGGFCAAARQLHTGLPGIRCHTTGPYPLDRASSLMATWSPLPALLQNSMPLWLSRRCCVGTQLPKKSN